jgi:ABC-2 type transport system ATP-binding protein
MEKVLSLSNLKLYYGDQQVLKGIHLDVFRGDIIGYIGPNGAGKSTTIKIILGLIDEYTGEVEVFGKRLKQGDSEYKGRLGYVPESSDMYEQLTPREYLSFIGTLYGMDKREAEEKAFQLLRLLEMEDVFDHRIDSFSKGMRQKVLIVSSLLHNPDIIFLDEPLNGLDTNSVSVIKEIFRKLAAHGKTIFFSSHIMEVVENLSSRIVLLQDGKIVADDTFAGLREQNKQGSLEGVFNQLTGFEKQDNTIDTFVDYVLNEEEKRVPYD